MHRLRLALALCALTLLLSAAITRAATPTIVGSVRPHPTAVGRYLVSWEIPRDSGTRQELVRCPANGPCQTIYQGRSWRSATEVFLPQAGDAYILSVIDGANVTTQELGTIPADWRRRWTLLPSANN